MTYRNISLINLDTQPIIPITTDVEMNSSFNEIISKLSEDQTYQNMFKDAFDNGEISSENILKALSQFMVMMVSSNSKYDRARKCKHSNLIDHSLK